MRTSPARSTAQSLPPRYLGGVNPPIETAANAVGALQTDAVTRRSFNGVGCWQNMHCVPDWQDDADAGEKHFPGMRVGKCFC